MRPAVRPGFLTLSRDCEAVAHHPYVDTKRLITTAIGVLCDAPVAFFALPWMIDGRPAREGEIMHGYTTLRDHRSALAPLGGMHKAQIAATKIRLTDDGIMAAVGRKIAEAEAAFRRRWPEWEARGADAQLLALSLAWAVGAAGATGTAPHDPSRNYPKFAAAYAAGDYATAGKESHLDEHDNHGVAPRNIAMRICAHNALIVARDGLDPDVLHWPASLGAA